MVQFIFPPINYITLNTELLNMIATR